MTTAGPSPTRHATPPGSSRGSRMSADERRAAMIAAATEEFATGGFVGASTEAIARRVGVSQPYVFQLFGTKKELFLAVIRSCFARTTLAFEDAAARWVPGDSDCDTKLGAMGLAYHRLLSNRTLLLVQLQAYAASSDPDVRTVVREEFSRLHRRVAEVSEATSADVHVFFSEGMLLNVAAALELPGFDSWSLEAMEAGTVTHR